MIQPDFHPPAPGWHTTVATHLQDAESSNSNHNNDGSTAISLPVNLWSQPEKHTSRSINGIQDQTGRSTMSSEGKLMSWILMGLLSFTLAWKYTTGGYRCSMLLFPLLLAYVYFSENPRPYPLQFVKYLFSNIKGNIKYVLQMERKQLVLLLAYAGTKLGLLIFHPKLERSNGTPMSLILFTVYFIMLFIIPSLVITIRKAATYTMKFSKPKCKLNRVVFNSTLCQAISKWRKSIMVTVIAIFLSYLFDGDLTCILRYFGHGRSCWPLLIPSSLRDSLPYPLQHAWFKGWHQVFSSYNPSSFVKEMIFLGREMEVIHLLPVLIGTYILSQLLLPRENWIIKKVLFGCISGVVLSGVTSGALKLLLHRYRPNAYGDPYMWTGPSTATVNHLAFSKLDLSFPCGHTTVSTSIATCLYYGIMYSLQLPLNCTCTSSMRFKIYLVVCLFLYPVIVFISRVSECNHWTSDAIFGVS